VLFCCADGVNVFPSRVKREQERKETKDHVPLLPLLVRRNAAAATACQKDRTTYGESKTGALKGKGGSVQRAAVVALAFRDIHLTQPKAR